MENNVITLDSVSKYYKLYNDPRDRLKEALHPFKKQYHKKFYALKNINLSINKGDIIGVVGRNGCGKSTLLKLISGVLQTNSGYISVDGRITALLELGAGFNPEFTGTENIHFYASILGLPAIQIENNMDSIIDFAELGEFIDQPIKTYSSGMKSRLAFAVAIHVEPEILILDEVLSVGDALFKRKCYAKMEEFFKAGKTIIYVSHDADSVNKLCNRAILIHNGSIIMDGETKEVTKLYEKLLLTNNTEQKNVINEIMNRKNDRNRVSTPLPDMTVTNIDSKPQPYLISGLTPKSTVLYQNEDVTIVDPKLETLDGRQVNCPVFGEQYKFVAQVHFQCNCKVVSFGFEIKDIKGSKITTLESQKQNAKGLSVNLIESGAIADVCIIFPCLFSTGDYYINFGISSFNGAQKVLTRGVDLIMFRAMHNTQNSSGFIDIISSLQVTIEKKKVVELVNGIRICSNE